MHEKRGSRWFACLHTMWARFSAAARAARRTSLHTTAGVLGAAGFACGASLLALPHVAAASAPAPLASAAAPLPPPLQAPPPIQDVIASAMPSLVKISGETVDAISGRVVAQGEGSGFLYDATGPFVATDHHTSLKHCDCLVHARC